SCRTDTAGGFSSLWLCLRLSRFSYWMNLSMGWIHAKRLRWPPFSARSLRPGARFFFPFISLRMLLGSVAGFFFSLRERSWDAGRWKSCGARRVSNQKIWRQSSLRLPELRSVSRANQALVLQELHNLLSGRAFWFTMLVFTLLSGYSFIQAVDLYSQASRSAVEYPELARGMVPLEGILVPTLGAFY